jgi:hypothetical protein
MVQLRQGRQATVERLERRQLLSTTMVANPADGMTAAPAFAAGAASPTGFTPANVRSAYGISSISFAGTAGTGAGQTIAIVVAYDDPDFVDSTAANFASSDLHTFDAHFGIADPPSFAKVNQSGGTTLPQSDPTGGGWADETALDVEWVHATAPAANILLVECQSDGLDDLIQGGVNYARQQPGVSVVSMSFASPESASETQYDAYFTTPAGHAGVTFVAAAGDDGAPAEYPAASPEVVGVGGTLAAIAGGTYGGESGLGNGGGGVSAYEPKPGYQAGLTQSATNRLTPDVSFEANHVSNGNDVYDSFNGGSNPWYVVGGTSFATAVWAGLIATADQGRARLGLPTMDSASQTLPRLYYLSQSDFHDVTTGDNGNAAGTGYDLVTGRGTPIANQLVPDLAGGASISGETYLDSNADGSLNNGEVGLGGVGVFLDLFDAGVPSGDDPVVYSNASGLYGIADLPGGTYRLNTIGITSYHKTTAAYYTIDLSYGQAVLQQQIGEHYDTGSIAGYVFEDLNNSRARTGNDPGYAGWTVYLDNNNDGVLDAGDTTATSNASGYYDFASLKLGSVYYVRQTIPAGYSRTTLGAGAAVDVALFGGTTTVNLGYVPNTSSISGTVFADTNGDSIIDGTEAGLAGQTVYLDLNHDGTYTPGVDLAVTTVVNGLFTIGGLAPGTYVVNAVVPAGSTRTTAGPGGYTVVVGVAQAVTGEVFGDYPG